MRAEQRTAASKIFISGFPSTNHFDVVGFHADARAFVRLPQVKGLISSSMQKCHVCGQCTLSHARAPGRGFGAHAFSADVPVGDQVSSRADQLGQRLQDLVLG
jgi:hypothetical protein